MSREREAVSEQKYSTPEVSQLKRPRGYNSLSDEGVIKESFAALKTAHKFDTIQGFAGYLLETLPQNSYKTRVKYTQKIIQRYIQKDGIKSPLVKMFHKCEDDKTLNELMYYHFLQSETIVNDFVRDVLYPSLEKGELSKQVVGKFVERALGRKNRKTTNRLPSILRKFEIIEFDSREIKFTQKKPSLFAFCYSLHYEFTPKMYLMETLAESNFRKIFLMTGETLRELVQESWQRGVIGYNNIDNREQIVVRYALGEVVDKICGE